MNKISVSSLKKGDRFSKPVYLDADTVFISSNSPISDADLERLSKFGITEVFSDGSKIDRSDAPAFSPKSQEDKLPFLDQSEDGLRLKVIYDKITHNRYEFDSLYSSTLETVQKAYKSIADGKNVEVREFREVGEKIVDFVKANPQVAVYLNSQTQTGYYLFNQVVSATFFSILLGSHLDYSRPKLIDLSFAGLFADIGMSLISSQISEKTTVLDENDRKIIMKHTLTGYQVLTQKVKLKNALAVVCLQHHENFDGTGYPQRMAGNSIEEFSRIYTIADNFSALSAKRPYRTAFLPHDAIKMMIGEMVTKFDLKMVRLFLNILSMYPLGSYVELSDGRIAMVVDVNKDKPIRPSVRIIKESNGEKVRTLQFCNLGLDLQVYITSAVDSKKATS
ncbi:HD-GYP domain-containing protein [Leptospira sp. GIMC2001]|uniref:HD-GYP domain-containing protein n=1 Tax=Leptospira sp. GIMC2001 TaxID=1513297 RepID=UPI00234B0975|nr:HD-GYP domain-containing protein [Leptospira sp. GIMC2001]WCL47928.1 HD-GYP domain-containing protein [Leptospira sp. GIMC2001]